LILHTLISGDSSRLTEWAFDLDVPHENVTFFNFLASHDGIGLRPVAEILSDEELEVLVALPSGSGGNVSYRTLPDGGRSPYELNLTYLDALTDLQQTPPCTLERFLTAHAMMLAMPGVPGIYFHSLFGIRNDLDGVVRTGRARSINRQKLEFSFLMSELDDVKSEPHRIFEGLANLLRVRAAQEAFGPWQGFQPIDVGPDAFAFVRGNSSSRRILCMHEVAGKRSEIRSAAEPGLATDLIARESVDLSRIQMAPYQSRWITLEPSD
jgi:sucrose phosphorylase